MEQSFLIAISVFMRVSKSHGAILRIVFLSSRYCENAARNRCSSGGFKFSVSLSMISFWCYCVVMLLSEILEKSLPGGWKVVKQHPRSNVYPPVEKSGYRVVPPFGYQFKEQARSKGSWPYHYPAHVWLFPSRENILWIAENIASAVEPCPADCRGRLEKLQRELESGIELQS